jgi:ATP-dependent RNA helicase DBP3
LENTPANEAAEVQAASTDRKEKKRKRESEANEGKKDQKKRKQEPKASSAESELPAVDEPGMLHIEILRAIYSQNLIVDEEPKKKSKRDKKKSKSSSEQSAEASSIPTPKDENKKKRGQQEAEHKNVASSSRRVVTPPSQSDIDEYLAKNSITLHGTTPLTPILTFNQLDVPEGLRAACDKFKEPTPIQACSWPAALAGQDVVGIAETGRSVTAMYGLA